MVNCEFKKKKRLNFLRCCNSEDNEHFLSQSKIFFSFSRAKEGLPD